MKFLNQEWLVFQNSPFDVPQVPNRHATVPGQVAFSGKTPDGTPYDIVVKWLTGEVGY